TGRPKGVELSHRNALGRAITYVPSVGMLLDSGTRTLGAAPLYHTVGLHYVLCVSLYLGGTYYPVRDLDGTRLLETVRDEELTFLFGSPTLFHGMVLAARETSWRADCVTH